MRVKLFEKERLLIQFEIFQSDKFYLLNIWSSWCVPCREEHPVLMELEK